MAIGLRTFAAPASSPSEGTPFLTLPGIQSRRPTRTRATPSPGCVQKSNTKPFPRGPETEQESRVLGHRWREQDSVKALVVLQLQSDAMEAKAARLLVAEEAMGMGRLRNNLAMCSIRSPGRRRHWREGTRVNTRSDLRGCGYRYDPKTSSVMTRSNVGHAKPKAKLRPVPYTSCSKLTKV